VWAQLGIETSGPGIARAVLLGTSFWIPLLATGLLTSRAIAEVFARWRRQPLDRGWFITAWVYTLLLPASLPLPLAAVGLAFGLVFGCYAFGGSDRQLVSPAVLGVIFIAFSYPHSIADTQWLPGASTASTWSTIINGTAASGEHGATTSIGAFLGDEIGALGTSSAAACLLGALFLIARRAADWRIVASASIAVAVAGAVGGTISWTWHFAAGQFAFALAFIAIGPGIRPSTSLGSLAFGTLFGALTVLLRLADPEHPEGTLPALLLATLCVPLLDHVARAVAPRTASGLVDDG